MFDLEFVIPVCLKGKYLNRINNYLKYGIINKKEHSVNVVLLIDELEKNKISNLIKNNNNVKVVLCPIGHEACKVHYYFSNCSRNDLNNTKWIVKADDDSVTDVDLLLKYLTEEFDYKQEHYLIAGYQQDIDHIEKNLLLDLGYRHWFGISSYAGDHIVHEKECSIISQAGLKKILTTPDAVELLTKRSFIEDGHTDQCLAAAARIAKIYPYSPQFLTSEPLMHDFSLFGGGLAHIHFIAEDIDCNVFDILKNKIDNVKTPEVFNELLTNKYKMTCALEEAENLIVFKNDYTIRATNYFYWKFWSYNKNVITMHSLEGVYNISLNNINLNNCEVLKGDHGAILRAI